MNTMEIKTPEAPKPKTFNKTFGQVYKSEFNMALMDFERFDQMLREIDELMIKIRIGQWSPDRVHLCFSILKQMYIYFETVHNPKKNEIEETFKNVEDKIIEMKKNPGKIKKADRTFFEALEKLNREVYALRQRNGMGIPVFRQVDPKERLSKALED